jgi:CheY-like chemotaxis protein/anti-sigma regulatory factor (Ser/Thr protein kinase)
LRYDSLPIKFIVQVDENMPHKVIGDELRIKQILNNLLSNAFKYTDEGEITLSAAFEPGDNDETVKLVFQVSDTGQGMSKEQVDRIFDEYARFNMEENVSIQGTGLGMTITRRLVDMMDGDIFVASELNKGTTVTVRLPQKRCGLTVCGAEVAKHLRDFNFIETSISKKASFIYEQMPYGRVLVVDDVESNLFVARGMLVPYRLHVETAKSGLEAIGKIKKGKIYDMVLMDHMMPKMDGIEATENLRGLGYSQPIVALTANAITGQAEKFLALGFDGFISKPIDSRELDRVLKELIRDRKPPEIVEAARREKHKTLDQPQGNGTELRKLFVKDAEVTLNVLENTYARLDSLEDTDINSYTIAVHGIKSGLKNIGETDLSEFAFKLEKAGKARNLGVVADATPEFISQLKSLMVKLKPEKISRAVTASRDDMLYLTKKLSELASACKGFNIRTAKEISNDLKQKTWPPEIDEALNEISLGLLRGDFKKVVSIAAEILKLGQLTDEEGGAMAND